MENEQAQLDDEVNVPIKAIQIIDPAVIAKLPQGTNAVQIEAHGSSFWTRTARLETERGGIKGATTYGERGRQLLSSEYHCMEKLYTTVPDLVPQPIAWGSYSSMAEVHFFLSEFRPMTGGLPDIETFPAKIAEMHRAGTLPDGRFGFDVTTFHGEIPIEHGWSDTWEEYFARTTRILLQLEQDTRGPREEMQQLPWNEINKPYRERYHEHFPKSNPEADHEDRSLLYATRVNMLDSILYKNDPNYREM
ncbi:hypothetical protein UCREL1_7349 [Eutypa lata UCREL1]|uniref:protein-ribulosamine 3-kinase n=1 Tax=Eutypa lata (strain UCR-EL1) TaxID=1287681 RepID=M7T7B9_EUTLA|nr:hypothetical protein UCREL1_7349 [Eutypa lata UCREL1]